VEFDRFTTALDCVDIGFLPDHTLDELPTASQVGATRVADEQGVPAEHEPRFIAACVVGDHVGVMGAGVTGRCQRLDLGVAELHPLAVGEGGVLELHPGAFGQVGVSFGALDELRQSRNVIGLNVCLEDGDDRHPLALG